MIDLDKTLEIATIAAEKAGRYLMAYFGGNLKLYNKDNTSSGIYSEQDEGSSNIIIETILEEWFKNFLDTEVLFISEENKYPILAKKNDTNVIERNNYKCNIKEWNGMCWVIDPICGSVGYARGIRDFIISIALIFERKVLMAVVYDPPHKEMFHAVLGRGAYLNDTQICPANTASLEEAIVSLEHQVYKDVQPEKIRRLALSVRKIRTAMTCALEMCYVACGRIDAVVKLDQAFYDYIGGALILSEALEGKKGLVNINNGKSILPFEYLGWRVSFIAANGLISDKLMTYFTPNQNY